MRDPFEDQVAGLDAPRALDPEFRSRLERAIVGASAASEPDGTRWRIDVPREPTPEFRAQLEAGLTSPRRDRGRTLTRFIAAAVTMVLAAGATVVVVDRLGAPNPPTASGPIVSPSPSPSPAGPPTVRPKGSLQGFRSSSAFLAYVRGEALELVGPYGFQDNLGYARGPILAPAQPGAPVSRGLAPSRGGVPAPQPAAQPMAPRTRYSETNIQEAGVDEPDIVKTDGRRLVVLTGADVEILDVRNGTARKLGTLRLSDPPSGAFLWGDKVMLFSPLGATPSEAVRATHALQRPWTRVSVVDISNPSVPRIASSMSIEGSLVGARLARGIIRMIVQSGSLGPAPVTATAIRTQEDSRKAVERNKRTIRVSSVGDWVPHFVVQRKGRTALTGHVHDWRAVSRPPDRAGLSMLTVLTIDPNDPRPDNAASVVGAGQVIYSSLDNLYVTSGRFDDFVAVQRGRTPRGPITRIHKFDIRDPRNAVYRGSGVVPGFLLNQFSLSEHAGNLRVASTLDSPTSGNAGLKSSVFVLRERAGKLVIVGTVGNLGLGERIYSVRFLGTKAYVVTFRQIDPLYVIDLRVPTRPRVAGQLKVPGYSGYLHPISDALLMGVGQDADANGQTRGLQLSLFDVSNPAKPRRLDVLPIGSGSHSEVESDHHSFLYWPARRLVVVPMSIYSQSGRFVGALTTTIGGTSGFGQQVRITHVGRPHAGEPGSVADPTIRRSIVIGSRLLTISGAGVLVSDLGSLGARTWVPYRE